MSRAHLVEWFMFVASLNLMAFVQPVNDLHPEAHCLVVHPPRGPNFH